MEFVANSGALIGATIIGYASLFYNPKKKDRKRDLQIAGVLVLLLSGFSVVDISSPIDSLWSSITGGAGTFSVASADPSSTGCDSERSITTLSVQTKIEGSNSMTGASGTLRIYEEDVDPSSSTATALQAITITSGVGNTSASSGLKTCRNYRVVFDGSTSYYDIDYGIGYFDYPEGTTDASITETFYVSESNDFLPNPTKSNIYTIATITKPLATDVSTLGNDASEVTNTSTVITYNETAGDGQYKIRHRIEFTGANSYVKCPVLGYEWDLTNPPEGNEISEIKVERYTGFDFNLPSELSNQWSNEEPILLSSDFVSAGKSGDYDFTYTVTEANLDSNDDFFIYVDDLCAPRERDVRLDDKATIQRIQYDDV